MRSILLFFALIISTGIINAQSYMYKNCSTSSVNCIYTISGNSIYKGNSTSSLNCVFTFDGTYVYKGASTSSYNCVYTIKGGYIYKGSSTSSSNCLYTVKDGYIYQGNSTSSVNCKYTITGNYIYNGSSTSSSNCTGAWQGTIDNGLLALLTVEYFGSKPVSNDENASDEFGKATGTFDVGSLVGAKLSGSLYKFAVITKVSEDKFEIKETNGTVSNIDKDLLIAIPGDVKFMDGDPVMAVWPGDMKFYDGVLFNSEEDGAFVKWNDGSKASFVKYNMMIKK